MCLKNRLECLIRYTEKRFPFGILKEDILMFIWFTLSSAGGVTIGHVKSTEWRPYSSDLNPLPLLERI
jgi:hypothetical protein